MPVIRFLPSQKEIEVNAGISILQAEQLAGLRQDAPCGGHGKCGKCKVRVNGAEVLACRTPVQENMTVTLEHELTDARILAEGIDTSFAVQPVEEGAFHISVDIGTTTVVAYLLECKTGAILAARSMLNPQFPYGADVISRIQAALDGKMQELTSLIRDGVWSLVEELCEACQQSSEQIGTMAVVANPAMQQLFFGILPDNLSRPPFSPIFTKTEIRPLSEYFPVKSRGKLLIVPDIAGYVGADTMGCILAAGLYQEEKITLMIDIGTNGEMVLGNRDKMVACSTAAGPALEGGRISCGMRGSSGAIDHLWLEDGKIAYSVIGDVKPKGLCGSGLIDAAAALLDLGVLNKRGRIQKDYVGEGKARRYVLTDQIFLTQEDIREVQMAKGAIAAGIQLLMQQRQVTMEEIDQVILCGAFGNYMKPESACRIGLIPPELLDRIKAGGNAAGMGSRQMALDRELYHRTEEILKKTEAVELASIPEFQRIYAEHMMFPA